MSLHNAVHLRQFDEDTLDSGSSRVLLCGKSFIADRTGALYWPAESTLIVSDLHLETGSYLDEENAVLPPYDTATVLERLEDTLDRYDPDRVIALGDSFCGDDETRISAHDSDWLYDLMEERDWFWISANDQTPVPECFGGSVLPHVTLGGIKFRYEPVRAPISHEIAGRMHPIAQISEYGYVMSGRCFVSNGMRLILPSMGKYTQGANVLGSAFDSLLGQEGLFVWAIHGGRVSQVASGLLLEDEAA